MNKLARVFYPVFTYGFDHWTFSKISYDIRWKYRSTKVGSPENKIRQIRYETRRKIRNDETN